MHFNYSNVGFILKIVEFGLFYKYMLCHKFLPCFKTVHTVFNIITELASPVLKTPIGFGEIKIEEQIIMKIVYEKI